MRWRVLIAAEKKHEAHGVHRADVYEARTAYEVYLLRCYFLKVMSSFFENPPDVPIDKTLEDFIFDFTGKKPKTSAKQRREKKAREEEFRKNKLAVEKAAWMAMVSVPARIPPKQG